MNGAPSRARASVARASSRPPTAGRCCSTSEASLPPALQAKFLRVLERREAVRVGSQTPLPLDVRVIAATNRDLRVEIERGRFRERPVLSPRGRAHHAPTPARPPRGHPAPESRHPRAERQRGDDRARGPRLPRRAALARERP
ncbi:MAG: sigma 54-interacting transcriptional regulator [Myxococcales bacterium]|nr:sigma 54-interacting transcriptional regulator [Myxococcales bacterium]